jgi:hypothetical protein
MPITFDGATKRIILDTTTVSAAEVWSRWVDWAEANAQWPVAFRQVGGDSLGGGLFIPPYFFLQNGWRVRPMESSHSLAITGNMFVDGGGVPVVQTLGNFNVSVQYTVPVQAQGISTGGSVGPTAAEIADAVWQRGVEGVITAEQAQRILLAALAGQGVVSFGAGPFVAQSIDGTKDRIVGTIAGDGTRTITTRDGT